MLEPDDCVKWAGELVRLSVVTVSMAAFPAVFTLITVFTEEVGR